MSDSAPRNTHQGNLPPNWAIERPKKGYRALLDLIAAPLRMTLLPDHTCENLGITSLRGERFAAVLPVIQGRLLDIGAGDNVLVELHRRRSGASEIAHSSVGVDVVDWGAGCTIIESSAQLPFDDHTFDTVSFVACINHIPERKEALREARRVLRPGGSVVITMIGRVVGTIGHRIWWYSEDKHRDVDEHEEMGLNRSEVLEILESGGFSEVEVRSFVYGLNTLYIAKA